MVASLQTLFTLTEGAARNACALVCKSVSRLREEAPLSECSPNVSARVAPCSPDTCWTTVMSC